MRVTRSRGGQGLRLGGKRGFATGRRASIRTPAGTCGRAPSCDWLRPAPPPQNQGRGARTAPHLDTPHAPAPRAVVDGMPGASSASPTARLKPRERVLPPNARTSISAIRSPRPVFSNPWAECLGKSGGVAAGGPEAGARLVAHAHYLSALIDRTRLSPLSPPARYPKPLHHVIQPRSPPVPERTARRATAPPNRKHTLHVRAITTTPQPPPLPGRLTARDSMTAAATAMYICLINTYTVLQHESQPPPLPGRRTGR